MFTTGDLNLLVALGALLEEVNVTKAAARLGLSQPTMSSALARLRRQYGDELLVRVGRDYELTPLARVLRPQIQLTLPIIEQAFLLQQKFEPASSERVFEMAMSDHAMSVLQRPLRARLARDAPGVAITYSPIPPDIHAREFGALEFDFLVGPRGYGFMGTSVDLFHERFVGVVDPHNRLIGDGAVLTTTALHQMDRVRAIFGGVAYQTPVDRRLAELGISRPARISVTGWLSVPFLISGTDMVAIMPERAARAVQKMTGVVLIELPFGDLDLHEALWWHPGRDADPGHRWLRAVIQHLAEHLEGPSGEGKADECEDPTSLQLER